MPEISDIRARERRRHRMFVTRNTEYHFRGDTCIAVRDRRTGTFRLGHLALNRRITGAVRLDGGSARAKCETPDVGDALYFGADGRDLVTTELCAIERPDKDIVRCYPC